MKAPRSRHLVFWPVAAAGFVLDLASKEVVFACVGDAARGERGSVAVIPGVFRLTTSLNPGALWGLGAEYNWGLLALASAAAVGILTWVIGWLRDGETWLTTALGLIEAGALGNVLDRIRFQGVRDFLDVELIRWPVFNLADTWLVIGAAMMVWQSLASRTKSSTSTQMP